MACVTIDDNFTIVRGEKKTLYLTINQTDEPDSLPFNLTGYTVEFAMNLDDAVEEVSLVSKTTDDPVEGDILTPADGTVAIYFGQADTVDLALGPYTYEIWLVKVSADVDERLWEATLNIVKRIRPLP